MMDAIKELVKQPFWIIGLLLGVVLVAFPCITIDKDFHWTTHPPTTLVPVAVGIALLILSSAIFAFTLVTNRAATSNDVGAGLDLNRVREIDGALSANVGGCEIRVVEGRLEDFAKEGGMAIVLPCNEYFDDRCVNDVRSALGAYVNREFEGQVAAFDTLVKEECRKKLGPGEAQQKTPDERAESFGVGRCLLLDRPLGRSVAVALVSTTTQRAGEGLAARIFYLFGGMRELIGQLADARLNDVAMPVLGAGHGGIDPPLALVGLLLALADAARYGQRAQSLKRVTVVVFKRDPTSPAQVDKVVVRRALALIGSPV